jgi:hypothetical protein
MNFPQTGKRWTGDEPLIMRLAAFEATTTLSIPGLPALGLRDAYRELNPSGGAVICQPTNAGVLKWAKNLSRNRVMCGSNRS